MSQSQPQLATALVSVIVFVRKGDSLRASRFPSLAQADAWAQARGWHRKPLERGWRYQDAMTRVMATAEYDILVPVNA